MTVTLEANNLKTELKLPASDWDVEESLEELDGAEFAYITITRCRGLLSNVELDFHPMNDGLAALDELNYLAVLLEDFTSDQMEIFEAIIETELDNAYYDGTRNTTAPLLDAALRVEDYNLNPFAHTLDELGYDFLFESGICEIPTEWAGLFDCKEFGLRLAGAQNGIFTLSGYFYKEKNRSINPYNGVVPTDYRIVPCNVDVLILKTFMANRELQKLD